MDTGELIFQGIDGRRSATEILDHGQIAPPARNRGDDFRGCFAKEQKKTIWS